MNEDQPEETRLQMERRSLAQVQRFDELLGTVVRERAGSEAEPNLSSRLLSRMESAPEAVPERRTRPRLLWLAGVSGLAATAVVAAFTMRYAGSRSHGSQGSHVGRNTLSSPAFRVELKTRPARPAELSVSSIRLSPMSHGYRILPAISRREAPAATSQEAALPKLETFPAREQSIAGSRRSDAAPDAVTAAATEVVVVPAPAWETAELHIQPISMKALPSEKDPQ